MAVKVRKASKSEPAFSIGFKFLAFLEYDDGEHFGWATGEVVMRSFTPGEGWRYCVR